MSSMYLCSFNSTSRCVGESVGTTVTFTLGTLIYVYSIEVHFHY